MATLLLRLAGPLQSWGVQSRFRVRDTGREPSKSGVVGLLAAALGRSREKPISDLASLRMGVRVDQEGRLMRDYHTAGKGGYLKASGGIERKNLITSTRYYLADAAFLVGLEGSDDGLLAKVHDALRNPRWSLFLGRKAFVPGSPIWLADGMQDLPLEIALRNYLLLSHQREASERLRMVLESPEGDEMRNDQPVSFQPRRFVSRRVQTVFVEWPSETLERTSDEEG